MATNSGSSVDPYPYEFPKALKQPVMNSDTAPNFAANHVNTMNQCISNNDEKIPLGLGLDTEHLDGGDPKTTNGKQDQSATQDFNTPQSHPRSANEITASQKYFNNHGTNHRDKPDYGMKTDQEESQQSGHHPHTWTPQPAPHHSTGLSQSTEENVAPRKFFNANGKVHLNKPGYERKTDEVTPQSNPQFYTRIPEPDLQPSGGWSQPTRENIGHQKYCNDEEKQRLYGIDHKKKIDSTEPPSCQQPSTTTQPEPSIQSERSWSLPARDGRERNITYNFGVVNTQTFTGYVEH